MAIKSISQSEREGNQNKRDNRSCEQSVGNQNREVNRTRPSVTAKVNRSYMRMIVEIAGQKDAGGCESSDHRGAMLLHVATLDEIVSDGEQDGGYAVEGSVDRWEDAVLDLESSS